MEKLKITKGEWMFKETSSTTKADGKKFVTTYTILRKDDAGFYGKGIAKINPISGDEFDVVRFIEKECFDNASLICDAGNTYQQCETLPSELLRQRNELLDAMIKISELSGVYVNSIIDNCLTSCNKGKE